MEQNEGKEEEQEGEKRVISEKRGRKETFLKGEAGKHDKRERVKLGDGRGGEEGKQGEDGRTGGW